MGNNLLLYSIALGMEKVYFSTPLFEFFERENLDYDNLLETKGYSVDPFDYHSSQCRKHSSKKLRTYKIHSKFD